MIGLMLFGDLPSFSVLQSKVNWVEADLFLESGIFSDLSCNWQYV